jgi:hypothetical protein
VEPQQLGRGERLVKPEVLGEKPHTRAGFAIAERSAQHPSGAGCRLDEGQQHLDRGGLAGATLTSNGVSNLVKFWLGENGYAPFLANLRAGGV